MQLERAGAYRLCFSLSVLRPANAFSAAMMVKVKSERYLVHAAVSVNYCLDHYVRLLDCNPREHSAWAILRGVCNMNDQAVLRRLRKELARPYCGIRKRVGQQLEQHPFPLLQGAQDVVDPANPTRHELEVIQTLADELEDERLCCTGRVGKRLCAFTAHDFTGGNLSRLATLHRVLKLWRCSIQPTEQRHSGNKRHTNAKHGKSRRLKRQVAVYITRSLTAIARKHGARDFRNYMSSRTEPA